MTEADLQAVRAAVARAAFFYFHFAAPLPPAPRRAKWYVARFRNGWEPASNDVMGQGAGEYSMNISRILICGAEARGDWPNVRCYHDVGYSLSSDCSPSLVYSPSLV